MILSLFFFSQSRRCAGPHEEKKTKSTFYIVLSLINLDLITIFSTLFKKTKLFNKYYHCSSFPNRCHLQIDTKKRSHNLRFI